MAVQKRLLFRQHMNGLGAPPSWHNLGRRRRFRVIIGRLVAGSILGCAYVKEILSVEHKQQSVMGCRVCQLIPQIHNTE